MENVNTGDDAEMPTTGDLLNKKYIFDNYTQRNAVCSDAHIRECFDAFDIDGDDYLNKHEFHTMAECLFCHGDKPWPLSEKQLQDTLKLLDTNQDGKIDFDEFSVCWHHWLKQILAPVSALLVIDVQNDFIDGTLAIKHCPAGQEGAEVVPIINNVLDTVQFHTVVYTIDWHPPNHISFVENVCNREIHKTSKVLAEEAKVMDTVVFAGPPVTEQTMWPAHCIQNTWGAEQHQQLKIVKDGLFINKGTSPDVDSYSAFWDNKRISQTPLVHELSKRNITDVYICGLALDVCVGLTAKDALEHGFRTVIIDDACRGVAVSDIDNTKEQLRKMGAIFVDSCEVADMVKAVDRRPDLGYQAAVNVSTAVKIIQEDSRTNQADGHEEDYEQ
ncbi:Nicotinamidase [Lamellibrachia satsuma]|nr:Nicotinamidase [Lamellibrachia satsuma]